MTKNDIKELDKRFNEYWALVGKLTKIRQAVEAGNASVDQMMDQISLGSAVVDMEISLRNDIQDAVKLLGKVHDLSALQRRYRGLAAMAGKMRTLATKAGNVAGKERDDLVLLYTKRMGEWSQAHRLLMVDALKELKQL